MQTEIAIRWEVPVFCIRTFISVGRASRSPIPNPSITARQG
jgi:hypothetical protein